MENQFKEIAKDKIELVKQTQIEKKRVFIKSIRPQKNHRLFEFDLEKREVRLAQFTVNKQISFVDAMKTGGKSNKEVDGKQGCIYISAMNEKNAWKKFLKLF